jgi:hypothetical protein
MLYSVRVAALLQQEVQNEFQKGNASLPTEVQNLLCSSKEGSVGTAKPLPALLVNPDPNSQGQ